MTETATTPNIARRSTELAFPLIGTTYASRMTERIYNHLRNRLESDDDIHEELDEIMMESPPVLSGAPPNLTTRTGGHIGSVRDSVSEAGANVQGQDGQEIPTDSLLQHITKNYEELNVLTHQRFLQNVRHRLDRRTSTNKMGFKDAEIERAQGELDKNYRVAVSHLEKRLSNRLYHHVILYADSLER